MKKGHTRRSIKVTVLWGVEGSSRSVQSQRDSSRQFGTVLSWRLGYPVCEVMCSIAPPSDVDVARAKAALPHISFGDFGFGVGSTYSRDSVEHMERNLRSDDVVVCSYPKSGTNWVKQIVQMVRFRGDPALVERYAEVDLSTMINLPEAIPHFDFAAVEEPKPRAFFSHLPCSEIAKGARYIYVVRDMPDVAASLFKYLGYVKGNFVNHDVNDVAQLMMDSLLFSGSWEAHVAGFWQQRQNPNVLFLTFEGMKRDLAGTVARIAAFMNFTLTEEELGRVAEMSSFDYMKKHEDKIQGREWQEKVTGQGVKEGYTLVADGTSNKEVFDPAATEAMARHFREKAAPA